MKVLRRALVVAYELGAIGLGVAARAGERRRRAQRLTETLARLGPAYIKLGQVMSTRADVFPVEYVEELAKLQDALAPQDAATSLETLERELGLGVDFFEKFHETPVAAASLAQVYRATLPGGQDVAIKLQRPGLAELVALDAVILRRFAGFVGYWRNFKSDVVGIVDELVGRIFEEMDYNKEAESCERFRAMYAPDGDAGVGLAGLVYAPRVVDFLSTQTVLTMEWVEGLRLTDVAMMESRGIVPNEVLDRGLRASLHQLLTSGFMHTDPHPGNLIVAENGGLTYLDFGMTVEVPIETRRAMVRGLIGFVNRDPSGLVDDLRVMNFLPPHVDRAAAEEALRSVFAGESTTKVRNSNDFMGVVSQLSTALMKHGFRLPPYFSRILRALAALEGTATTIDPSFRVVDRSYPFVLSRVLSDRSPEMRESLRRLLLAEDGSIRYKRLIRLIRAYGVEATPMASSETETRSDCRQALDKTIAGLSELASGEKESLSGEDEARRATKTAMEDALRFLLSDRGESTRERLIDDFIAAFEALLDEDSGSKTDIPEGRFTVDDAIGAAKSAATAVGDNPDLWIPVLGRAASERETLAALRASSRVAYDRLIKLRASRRSLGRAPCEDAKELVRKVVHALSAPKSPETQPTRDSSV
ncbi:ABC1 family-domain-containing protein [Ostreococcus tauri]|nr:ABC1 family-domain-containing protein [Ostreococcus tauri]